MLAFCHTLAVVVALMGSPQTIPFPQNTMSPDQNLAVHIYANVGVLGSLSLAASPTGRCIGSLVYRGENGADPFILAFATVQDIAFSKKGLKVSGIGSILAMQVADSGILVSADSHKQTPVRYTIQSITEQDGKKSLSFQANDFKTNAVLLHSVTSYK